MCVASDCNDFHNQRFGLFFGVHVNCCREIRCSKASVGQICRSRTSLAQTEETGQRVSMSGGVWCPGVACPWCVLEANHGDYRDAMHRYDKAMSSDILSDRPHSAQAAWHAMMELLIRGKANGVVPQDLEGPPQPTLGAEKSIMDTSLAIMGYHNTMASSSSNKMPRTWNWLGVDTVPPPPPPPATGGAAYNSAASSSTVAVAAFQWLVIPADRAEFQVWGGKSTKWISYDADVQKRLRTAYAAGETVVVESGGHRYRVDTRPGHLEQVRADRAAGMHNNVRKVRIQDTHDVLDAVY